MNALPFPGSLSSRLTDRLAALSAPAMSPVALPPAPGVADLVPMAPPGTQTGYPAISPNAAPLPAPDAILSRFPLPALSPSATLPAPGSALPAPGASPSLRSAPVLDAPDTRLREAALRAQMGRSTPQDIHRLAQRMSVEASAPLGLNGQPASPLPSPLPPQSSVLPLLPGALQPGAAQRDEERTAGRYALDQQTAQRAQQDQANADAAVFGKTKALENMLKTHPEELGLTPEQVKEHLAPNPQENAHARYARLSGIYQESQQRAKDRAQQANVEADNKRQQEEADRTARAGFGSAAEAQASIPAGSKGQITQTANGRWVVSYGQSDQPRQPESAMGKLHADLAAAIAAGDLEQAAALRAAISNEVNKGNKPMSISEFMMSQMSVPAKERQSYADYRKEFDRQMREWQNSPQAKAEAGAATPAAKPGDVAKTAKNSLDRFFK